MYGISKNKRKYSSTPIVFISLDKKGNEQEEIVCICTGKKAKADELAQTIVQLLNGYESIPSDEDLNNILFKFDI